MAINAPLQGTSADIIKLAMIEIDRALPDILLLQVHDELVFEIKKDKVDGYAAHIKKIMEAVVPQEKLCGVPIVVEGKAGKNWGEMQKL